MEKLKVSEAEGVERPKESLVGSRFATLVEQAPVETSLLYKILWLRLKRIAEEINLPFASWTSGRIYAAVVRYAQLKELGLTEEEAMRRTCFEHRLTIEGWLERAERLEQTTDRKDILRDLATLR